MKSLQAAVWTVLLVAGLTGLSACSRAGQTGQSYVREQLPVQAQQEGQGDISKESLYVRDGDEAFTGENKGVGYEEGSSSYQGH